MDREELFAFADRAESDDVLHYGRKGQKWGIRNYQNPDGTLTEKGKARYIMDKTKSLDSKIENAKRGRKVAAIGPSGHAIVTSTTKTENLIKKLESDRSKMIEKAGKEYDKKVAKLHNKVSKQYQKEAIKVETKLKNISKKLYIDAYNESAKKMNSGLLDEFNKKYENKPKDDKYLNDYNKYFAKMVDESYSKKLASFVNNDKNYKKGEALVKKYGMTKWDDLAKDNTKEINRLRNKVSKYE